VHFSIINIIFLLFDLLIIFVFISIIK